MDISKKKFLFPRPEDRTGPFFFMKWIFFEANVLGIHPFSQNLKFRWVKLFRTILFLFIIALLFLLLIKGYVDTYKAGPSMSKVAGFLNTSTFVIIGFPVIIGHMKNYNYLRKSLDKISRIDIRFRSVFRIEYNYDSRRMTRNLMFETVFKISLFFLFRIFSKRKMTLFVSINSLVLYYFQFTMFNCSRQFITLGTIIVGHCKLLRDQIKSNRILQPSNYLDVICILHCELIECCYLSIKWFNQRFFLITSFYFLGFMCNFCVILGEVRRFAEENEGAYNSAYFMTWQVIRIYELWRLLATCSSIEDEVAIFYEEIAVVLANRNPRKLDTSTGILEVFLAKKPDVQFWGSGFFRMDNSLLHSMAATLTTCYVIIAQYMNSYDRSQGQ